MRKVLKLVLVSTLAAAVFTGCGESTPKDTLDVFFKTMTSKHNFVNFKTTLTPPMYQMMELGVIGQCSVGNSETKEKITTALTAKGLDKNANKLVSYNSLTPVDKEKVQEICFNNLNVGIPEKMDFKIIKTEFNSDKTQVSLTVEEYVEGSETKTEVLTMEKSEGKWLINKL